MMNKKVSEIVPVYNVNQYLEECVNSIIAQSYRNIEIILVDFDYSWQWAYRKKFEEAGLTALLGCGFDPGVTQAYCAYALSMSLTRLIPLIFWTATEETMGMHLQPTLTRRSTFVR